MVSPEFELYANAGRGFHSNDARGATISADPVSGDPAEPVDLFAAATGAETGFRWETDNFSLSSALWWLRLDSELVFVGDAGGTEASGETDRKGIEVLAEWRPFNRLHFDVSAAATRARALDSPGADRIPNALEYVVSGGVSALITDELVATLTVRHLGEAPLIEDNSVRSSTSTVANALLRWQSGRFGITGEVLNIFDTGDSDIQYFYASRLPGEPPEGVDDLHFHPAEPRTFRVSLRLSF
jgi:outer membrane receptor protein involved in Fe transport